MKIKIARMDSPLHVPGIGQLPAELNSVAGATTKAVAMTLKDGVVVCSTKHQNKVVEFLIPVENFRVLVPEGRLEKDNKAANG